MKENLEVKYFIYNIFTSVIFATPYLEDRQAIRTLKPNLINSHIDSMQSSLTHGLRSQSANVKWIVAQPVYV